MPKDIEPGPENAELTATSAAALAAAAGESAGLAPPAATETRAPTTTPAPAEAVKPTVEPEMEKPFASVTPPPVPTIGRVVILNSPIPISGQNDSAAIVTAVNPDETINVNVFQAAHNIPKLFTNVAYSEKGLPDAVTWHWPPRPS